MATFFSGTDTNTLREEGEDRNNLVSLIVNNEGTYSAAITRRNHSICKVSEEATYEFFGEGPRSFSDVYETEETYIEYFMFNIVRKESRSLQTFFNRLQEIIRKPKPVTNIPPMTSSPQWYSGSAGAPATGKPVTVVSQSPISPVRDPAIASAVAASTPVKKLGNDLPFEEYLPAPSPLTEKERRDIESHVEATAIQMLTGSVFSQVSNKFDLDNWVKTKMVAQYKRRFGDDVDVKSEFRGWLDNFMEYIIFYTEWPELDRFNEGDRGEIVAEALLTRLKELPSNIYLEQFIESLEFYLA